MKIYKITEASDYLGVSINKARALREALERIAEFQIWTGRNGAHNPDAVELQAMARSALEKGNKNGKAQTDQESCRSR